MQHNYVAEKNENFFHVNYGADGNGCFQSLLFACKHANTVEMAASKVHNLHASMQMM